MYIVIIIIRSSEMYIVNHQQSLLCRNSQRKIDKFVFNLTLCIYTWLDHLVSPVSMQLNHTTCISKPCNRRSALMKFSFYNLL